MLLNGYYYNHPYLHSSYNLGPAYFGGYPSYQRTRQDLEALARERERVEALAARRARRAQYLPHEDVDSDKEDLYGPLSQRERVYLDTRRRQEALHNRRQVEEKEPRVGEPRSDPTFKQSPSQASPKRSVPIHVPGSSSRKPSYTAPPPKQSSTPVIEYTQAHQDAAEKIQRGYRRYKALKSIDDVAAQFEQAKNGLVFPDSLDFVDSTTSGEVVTIPVASTSNGGIAMGTVEEPSKAESTASPSEPFTVIDSVDHDFEIIPSFSEDTSQSDQTPLSDDVAIPPLAYTKTNYPIHAYMEKLNVLLVKLDGVESYGSRKVRDRRKEAVRTIEEEAGRVESVWQDAWKSFVKREQQ